MMTEEVVANKFDRFFRCYQQQVNARTCQILTHQPTACNRNRLQAHNTESKR